MSKATKAQKTSVKSQEKAIREIIERYGETIYLRKSPYLILEIIREYGPMFLGGGGLNQSGPVPGSHGTPPPPQPSEAMLDLGRTVQVLSRSVKDILRRVERLEKKK